MSDSIHPDALENCEATPSFACSEMVSQRRCLAVLQNMWVRDPVRVRAAFLRHGEKYRRRFIEYALFAGCLTGRRIQQTFPEALIALIEWEEATREICGDPTTIPKPDPEHIKAVLSLHNPVAVITFGRIAGDAVATIWHGRLIRAPHPAARHKTVLEELRRAAAELSDVMALANSELSDRTPNEN